MADRQAPSAVSWKSGSTDDAPGQLMSEIEPAKVAVNETWCRSACRQDGLGPAALISSRALSSRIRLNSRILTRLETAMFPRSPAQYLRRNARSPARLADAGASLSPDIYSNRRSAATAAWSDGQRPRPGGWVFDDTTSPSVRTLIAFAGYSRENTTSIRSECRDCWLDRSER